MGKYLIMKKHILLLSTLTIGLLQAQTKDTTKVKQIEAVTVNGKKPLVERKVDRLVYNVQNSMLSEGSSGMDVLSNTPMLKVDEDKGLVSIVGKSGVSVMVNDRMLNLSGTELVNYIKNLRSENILKIEVITTPPSKYEAQGNSGIVNIVLKKNINEGLSGYLNTYYVQTTYPGFGGAAALNYSKNKIKTSLRLRGGDTEKKSVENYQIVGENSMYSRDERRDMNDGVGLNYTLDYSLTDKSTIGLIYDLGKYHSNMNINSVAHYFTDQTNTLNTDTYSQHRSTSNSQTLNLYFDQKFGEHKLSLGANYYGNSPDSNVNFNTIDLTNNTNQWVRNLSNVAYKIYSGQADLTLNYKKIQIETGAKYSQFSNDSDIKYLNLQNSDYVLDPSRSNVFNYTEKNYAAYVSASKELSEKWSAKAGLRYEYAVTNGISPTTQTQSESKYGKLFPTAYLSYKINDKNQLSLNYSKRINRPNFRAIDPFRWYSNPYAYYAGNPSLSPSYNHNFELNYMRNNKFNATLYYFRSIDNYDQITVLDGIYSVSTYHNFYNQNGYGIYLNYSDTFFKFWETNNSITASWNNMQVTGFDAIPFSGHNYSFSSNNTFRLNKAKTLVFFLNYYQSLPSKDGNYSVQAKANTSAGLRMSFMEKALQINLSANDIFRQSAYRGSAYFADNVQSFNNYWDMRKATLSVTYNFGNQKVKAINRNVNFDEKNRAN